MQFENLIFKPAMFKLVVPFTEKYKYKYNYSTNTIPCTHLDIVHSSQYV